ncbi:trehalose-6-phosphate synthase [Hordeum vulgare]|nr:trehalose-6-phosphate synthase [Hordeum vulgare]
MEVCEEVRATSIRIRAGGAPTVAAAAMTGKARSDGEVICEAEHGGRAPAQGRWGYCTGNIGVDRLDMIKGFLQKVLAFEKFLEENEELDFEYKVVLLQIAVPTKSDVLEYQKLASQVHELVARVNGRLEH